MLPEKDDYPVLTADELRKLPDGAEVVRNAAGNRSHLQVTHKGKLDLYECGADGSYALKSLPATQPDSGYIASVDEEGLVEEQKILDQAVEACRKDRKRIAELNEESDDKNNLIMVAEASSKPWLDGVTPWHLVELREILGCNFHDCDEQLQEAYEYLQAARGEA